MIYCIPLDSATEEFLRVRRPRGRPAHGAGAARCTLFKLAGELSLEALAGGSRNQTPGRPRIKYAAALN